MKQLTPWFSAVSLSVLMMVSPVQAAGEEKTDNGLITRLREEALQNSQVQDHFSVLTDEIGARLTGSPGLKRAADWAQTRLRSWGLEKVHTESFAPFGVSWEFEHARVRLLSPFAQDIVAIPKAWTPGTNGPVQAKVVVARLTSEEDLSKWQGKLAGMVVMVDEPLAMKPHLSADARRLENRDLEELVKVDPDTLPRRDLAAALKQFQFQKKLVTFLNNEKVLATLHVSRGDDGTIFVQGGGSYKKGEAQPPTALVLSSESYNRIYRLAAKKQAVEITLDVKVRSGEEHPENAVNVLADIPGSDKKDEIVMLGAHLDSWHGATGATDNAAGVAVMMEAVRLLREAGFKPRRTIRLALWGGEEQGLLGSRAWVQQWVAARPEISDASQKDLPSYLRSGSAGPLQLKALHGKISAYFNLDNGGGRIRGIYAENNAAAKPLFESWLAPFADLGANTVTLRRTGSTDHVSFDAVGVPGFQFIQDPLDYMSRTHHSNMDVYDKVPKADMVQASLVVASFIAHAANLPELLPRKPMPKEKTEAKNAAAADAKPAVAATP